MFKNKPKLTIRCKKKNFVDMYIEPKIPEKKLKSLITYLCNHYPQFNFYYSSSDEDCTIIQADRRV